MTVPSDTTSSFSAGGAGTAASKVMYAVAVVSIVLTTITTTNNMLSSNVLWIDAFQPPMPQLQFRNHNKFSSTEVVRPRQHPFVTASATASSSSVVPTGTSSSTTTTTTTTTSLHLYIDHNTDAENYAEMMVGGQRYSMVPLPDSMVSTTLFVGNLCEFVKDEDLSKLFQTVSTLNSVPACVARKPNYSSLQYGFVAFPTVEEKEKAIIRFDGYEWRGKKLKVEQIRDNPTSGRVRVPEKIVAYVAGVSNKRTTKDGHAVNQLRRVERIVGNGNPERQQTAKKNASKGSGAGSRKGKSYQLSDKENNEISRAAKKGFLVLEGVGHRRLRRPSPIVHAHRQWCDVRAKPQIIVYKATRAAAVPLDQVVVDLSPLRLNGLFDDATLVADFMTKWKVDILNAATNAGLDLREDLDDEEDDADDINAEEDDSADEDFDDEDCTVLSQEEDGDEESCFTVTFDTKDHQELWASSPIRKLPVVSIGTFVGERSKAKAMAKELAILWDIPENDTKGEGRDRRSQKGGNVARKGGKNKMRGLSQHRSRGGGHRQSFW